MKTFRSLRTSAVIAGVFLAVAAVAAEQVAGLPSAKPGQVGLSSERLARIAPVMQEFIDAEQVPGFVLAIARDGKLAYFETLGHMDVETGKEMRPDTIFRMYSMTKPVTGTAIMMLYEEGHFFLNDPIANYLPEFKSMRVYLGRDGAEIRTEPAKPITIKHLLTHTSGLSYDFFPNPVGRMYTEAGLGFGDAVAAGMTLEEWVKKAAEMPLVHQPGTAWHYSIGMDVLGRLVEVVSGQRYDEFLDERLFEPLNMKDAGFYVPGEKLDRFAAMYGPKPGGGMNLVDKPAASSYRNPPSLHLGGAGMVATAGDYLRFAQMLLNGGELDGVRILSPTTVDLMIANHLGPEYGDTPLAMLNLGTAGMFGRGIRFGLTGSVLTDPAAAGMAGSAGEFSWGGAASTDFWIDPQEKLVGLVLTQLIPAGTYPTRSRMHQMTYQAIME